MKKFVHKDYYKGDKDTKIVDNERNSIVHLKQQGRALITQYYAEKYNANITFPITTREDRSYPTRVLSEFAADIVQHLSDARTKTGEADYRQAFFIGQDSFHATPVIYIREHGKEAILIADSKGISSEIGDTHIKLIAEKTGIPVYAVEQPRQSDSYSCHTDALVFGKDTTAIDPLTKDYYIPNLLAALESNADKREGYFIPQLPDKLLKTAQLSSFVITNKQKLGEKIHREEDLADFRARYTDKDVNVKGQKNYKPVIEQKDVSSYARKKGIKFADVIEIQFYLNQIKEETGEQLSTAARKEFVQQAKEVLKQQKEPYGERIGLHDFAEKFLIDLKNNTPQQYAQPKEKSTENSFNTIKSKLSNYKKDDENLNHELPGPK